MKEYGRDLRVADFVQQELAQIIRGEMRDPRVGLLSINDVRVSKDLSYADVYVTALGCDDQAGQRELIGVLSRAAGFLRSTLAKRHSMRTTPRLRFHYDEVAVRGPQLEALIERAVHEDAANSDAANSDAAETDQKERSENG